MANLYTFPIIIESDEHGYFAKCPALHGCSTQGDTYQEALENIKEAIELYMEDIMADGNNIQPLTISVKSLTISQ